MLLAKKEKREEVLYVKVSKTNKTFIKKYYKQKGYATASEFIDELITVIRKKEKQK